MWDLIVSVPDHCLSFYFRLHVLRAAECSNGPSSYFTLSYEVAVTQWLTSCHKNRMTTRYLTLCYCRVTFNAVCDNVTFSFEIM